MRYLVLLLCLSADAIEELTDVEKRYAEADYLCSLEARAVSLTARNYFTGRPSKKVEREYYRKCMASHGFKV